MSATDVSLAGVDLFQVSRTLSREIPMTTVFVYPKLPWETVTYWRLSLGALNLAWRINVTAEFHGNVSSLSHCSTLLTHWQHVWLRCLSERNDQNSDLDWWQKVAATGSVVAISFT